MSVRVGQKKRPEDHSLATRGLLSDSEGQIFLSYPHTNNGFFILAHHCFFFFLFIIRFQKSLNTLTMTSLDDHVREFKYNQCM